MIELFLKLVIGHAIADFWMQTDAIATGKNRNIDPEKFGVPWWYWLTAHALMHGGVVWAITGNVWLGCAEIIAHWLIDFGKCEKWYGIHEDQAAHIWCKIMWVGLA